LTKEKAGKKKKKGDDGRLSLTQTRLRPGVRPSTGKIPGQKGGGKKKSEEGGVPPLRLRVHYRRGGLRPALVCDQLTVEGERGERRGRKGTRRTIGTSGAFLHPICSVFPCSTRKRKGVVEKRGNTGARASPQRHQEASRPRSLPEGSEREEKEKKKERKRERTASAFNFWLYGHVVPPGSRFRGEKKKEGKGEKNKGEVGSASQICSVCIVTKRNGEKEKKERMSQRAGDEVEGW